MRRDQLDALIDAQGFTVNMCADPGCRAEHEVLEISDLLTILAVVPEPPTPADLISRDWLDKKETK